ncbi:prepilin peptidase [Aliisedimentitalea scapharcae]|uniref:Prepilin peptidase n=1 Tax=Aliisedimentitalea scapharcae TaxID=1524259 RepID=A0ABZ2XVG2_9RHOB|nr:prepilin peptidase [Rhodobacteraceae bacterium M382]
MALTTSEAWWFLPFVLPICFYVAFTDLREMRITNQAVLVLAGIFLIVGLFVLPLPVYGARVLQMIVVLIIGILLNAGGAIGAGDAKFAAAAAPLIAPGDLRLLLALFAANLLAAFVTHRLVKYTPLRQIAPNWQSWDMGWKFPMGLSLGGTLALYLILGTQFGS